jgi:hypothetical protein
MCFNEYVLVYEAKEYDLIKLNFMLRLSPLLVP